VNEPTEFGAENEALARRYGIQRPGPVFTFASDAFPIIAADAQMDPELHFLANSRLCAAFFTDGATAGQNSSVNLVNPANSGLIAVCDFISANVDAAATLQIGVTADATVDSSQVGQTRDPRWPINVSACLIGPRTAVALTVGGIQRQLLGTTALLNELIGVPFIITPGSKLAVINVSGNSAVTVSFAWRERRAGTNELRIG
jgi:hypothetical protein